MGPSQVTVVLDCSVAVAWCFEDEADDDTDRILDAVRRDGAVVPAVWGYELANVLAIATRRGRITLADRAAFLDLLGVLPIEVVDLPIPAGIGTVSQICESFNLAAYDAAYLEVAMQRRLPIATLDSKLRVAARNAGIGLFRR